MWWIAGLVIVVVGIIWITKKGGCCGSGKTGEDKDKSGCCR